MSKDANTTKVVDLLVQVANCERLIPEVGMPVANVPNQHPVHAIDAVHRSAL